MDLLYYMGATYFRLLYNYTITSLSMADWILELHTTITNNQSCSVLAINTATSTPFRCKNCCREDFAHLDGAFVLNAGHDQYHRILSGNPAVPHLDIVFSERVIVSLSAAIERSPLRIILEKAHGFSILVSSQQCDIKVLHSARSSGVRYSRRW